MWELFLTPFRRLATPNGNYSDNVNPLNPSPVVEIRDVYPLFCVVWSILCSPFFLLIWNLNLLITNTIIIIFEISHEFKCIFCFRNVQLVLES